jgi:hypothetical protein
VLGWLSQQENHGSRVVGEIVHRIGDAIIARLGGL